MYNNYRSRRPTSYGGPQSGGRRFGGGGRFGRRRPSGRGIRIDQLIAKAVYEDLPSIYELDKSILDFKLADRLKENITFKKYTTPTKIQYQTIPAILEGKDILGLASTGSGKTASFLIPMVHKAIIDRKNRVLIIVPTRELALQIQDEFTQLAHGTGLKSVLIIGGNSMYVQMDILRRNPNFIIATPGRLKDISDRRAIDLSSINNVVLDEVDRMLDMGFIDDIRYITSRLGQEKQSLFFSATMNRKAEEIANSLLKNPMKVEVEKQSPGKNVDQDVIRLGRDEKKADVLYEYLQKDEFKKVLIFTRTKRDAEKVTRDLSNRGMRVDALHGDKRQAQRTRIINAFKSNVLNVLVATDVASRGIDVNNITHVINYDIPESYEDYIHRIGRTGRAGKKGIALTFVG